MGLFSRKETEEQMVKRLAGTAGNIAEMLKAVLRGPNGTDLRAVLLYAAGLAGHACHEAVKAENGEFAVVTDKDGRRYYFGDAVNRYLLEGNLSVYSFCSGVCGDLQEKVTAIIAGTASAVGNGGLKIWGSPAEKVYPDIVQCWDGIYSNMTEKYCRKPEEWPVLYGIVLQEVIRQSIAAGAPEEEAGLLAMEGAAVISKMDSDSL